MLLVNLKIPLHFINNLSKLNADALITDLSMPGDKYGDGITLIKYIKRHYPNLSIIVLTMNNNPAILSAVLDLEIEGIVLKQGALLIYLKHPHCKKARNLCLKAWLNC